MAYEVIVKKRFTNKIIQLLNHIEREWGKPVADRFLKKLEKRISTLARQPYIGGPSEMKNVRSILIAKQNRLYYRIKGNQIEIITLFDTRMHPTKNRYKRK